MRNKVKLLIGTQCWKLGKKKKKFRHFGKNKKKNKLQECHKNVQRNSTDNKQEK